MSMYSEVINPTRLTNNHTNVGLTFLLRDTVVVDCVDGKFCATNVNSLPLPVYALLSKSQVFLQMKCSTNNFLLIFLAKPSSMLRHLTYRYIHLRATGTNISGVSCQSLQTVVLLTFKVSPFLTMDVFIIKYFTVGFNLPLGSVHTSIAATVNVSHWLVLRSHLATLLRMPLNPSRLDINKHPIKLSMGRAGVTQHEETTFTQVFPLLSANADTWKAWAQNLLPCKGKVGIFYSFQKCIIFNSI